jgi:hypothetical protein
LGDGIGVVRVSDLEEAFAFQLKVSGLPAGEREHRFHPPRRWRFDFAWPDVWVAVELEGGIWVGGGHVRGGKYTQNCEKYNMAALDGWCLLRFTESMVTDGTAVRVLREALRVSR